MATDGSDPDGVEPPPLENTAFFDIDTRRGYVRVDQSWGDQALYTPQEARDIARAILGAAESAEQGEKRD
ncbi:MAG: hypothetical protein V5A44_03820 [Haloarculaceae archaeon]